MPRVWPSALTTGPGDRYVLIALTLVARIEPFLARDSACLEAGGILLGLRRDPHIEVLDGTLPSRRDVRTRYGFTRQCASHQRAASKAWQESGEFMDYVGEWHTHPESAPRPSGIDRAELLRGSAAHHNEPLIELIVGFHGVYAGLAQGGSYVDLLQVTVVLTSP